jgi:hypothetical protein
MNLMSPNKVIRIEMQRINQLRAACRTPETWRAGRLAGDVPRLNPLTGMTFYPGLGFHW